MSDKYYKSAIMFHMRDFVSKIIGKYIEHIQEDKSAEETKQVQEILQDFQAWLYQTTQH